METKKKAKLITLILLAAAVVSFAVAGWYFWRANGVYDIYNLYVERTNSIPGPHVDPTSAWPYYRGFIVAWQEVGVGFTFLGLAFSTLAFTCYKQTRKIAVMILILLAAMFAAPQTAPITGRPGSTDVKFLERFFCLIGRS